MDMLNTHCDIIVKDTRPNIHFSTDMKQVILENMPKDKVLEVQAYAKNLKTKFPHIKSERLLRKVAKYFKIQYGAPH